MNIVLVCASEYPPGSGEGILMVIYTTFLMLSIYVSLDLDLPNTKATRYLGAVVIPGNAIENILTPLVEKCTTVVATDVSPV